MDEILAKIVELPFDNSQYYQEETKKSQIFLHHTVSGDNVKGIVQYWAGTKEHVATCIIIDRNGIPYQIYSSKHWAYHLGLQETLFNKLGLQYQNLDKTSIAIEICNFGFLTLKNGIYYNCYNEVIDPAKVVYYPNKFRGHEYYEKYTDAQIQTVKELILYWNKTYSIPLDFNEDMFNISKNCLSGKTGVWTHVSVNSEKSDCHPQSELVNMLKSLKSV